MSTSRASLEMPTTPFDRIVGDVRLADERHHVVLAVRIERDVAHQHHVLVAADLLEGRRQHLGRIVAVAGIKLLVGLHDATRRIAQALAVRIVARPGDQRPHRRLGLLARGPARHDLLQFRLQSFTRAFIYFLAWRGIGWRGGPGVPI